MKEIRPEMREIEKRAAGYLYDANYDEEICRQRLACADMCYEYNRLRPSDLDGQRELLRRMFGGIKGNITIVPPFYCDFGYNIFVGENFYSNFNCTILDSAPVTFGDNVFIAPNCVFSAAGHPTDAEQRNLGLEIALPVKVGNDVWFGAGVIVVPGVTIGDNVVVGAGSVITKDIPSGVVAAGNPCRVLRRITEEDKKKYPVYE